MDHINTSNIFLVFLDSSYDGYCCDTTPGRNNKIFQFIRKILNLVSNTINHYRVLFYTNSKFDNVEIISCSLLLEFFQSTGNSVIKSLVYRLIQLFRHSIGFGLLFCFLPVSLGLDYHSRQNNQGQRLLQLC